MKKNILQLGIKASIISVIFVALDMIAHAFVDVLKITNYPYHITNIALVDYSIVKFLWSLILITAFLWMINKYKSTKNMIYLQQAGEKLFNVIEGYLSYVNNVRIEYFQQARGLIKQKSLAKLLYDARDLHRFFYHGTNERLESEADELYQSVLNRIEQRISKI